MVEYPEEDRRRRQVFTGGSCHDDVLFGLTLEEYDTLEKG
jgi:hypothetical protein